MRERSLLLRFAANRPTQATSVDDLTLVVAVIRDGHVGRAGTNDISDGGLRHCARRAAAERRRGTVAGAFPGFGPLVPGRAHDGHDPPPPRWSRRTAAARWPTRSPSPGRRPRGARGLDRRRGGAAVVSAAAAR